MAVRKILGPPGTGKTTRLIKYFFITLYPYYVLVLYDL